MSKPKVIAFYLPQYHPIPQNDKWFGKGFTEWTNVGKAKPLFRGHYQPKVPADLGYYDLRLPEVREAQAELAKEAGIYGFCYWHYWFGNGKQLLERPFNEVLESGKPDFPFCLGWANHSWIAKNWDNRQKDEIIVEQLYPGKEDMINHFYYVLQAFKDSRYIKIKNKPIFFIFRPWELPKDFISCWNQLAKQNGLSDGICFIGLSWSEEESKLALLSGFSYVTTERLNQISSNYKILSKRVAQFKNIIRYKYFNCYNYKEIYHFLLKKEIDSLDKYIPMIIPNWDHSPRSRGKRIILHNSSPELFYKHVIEALKLIKNKPLDDQILVLKSWNEWGEGNYMEPDLKYGKGYIKALSKALSEYPNI